MNLKKILLISFGCIFTALGAAAAALPLIPSVPFLLLAAICFAKSSRRFHEKFTASRLYKTNLEGIVTGEGMTLGAKIRVMVSITLLMGIAFLMMHRVPLGRIFLVCIWLFHMLYFIFFVKKKPAAPASPVNE